MPHKPLKIWRYTGSSKMVGGVENGLSIVRISGIVTPTVLEGVVRDDAAWMQATGVMAQVARYEESALAIDAQSLILAAETALVVNPNFEVPTALVVHPDLLQMFEIYAHVMTERGVARAAFSDPEMARRWAAAQAPVYAALRRALGQQGFAAAPAPYQTLSSEPVDLQSGPALQPVARRPQAGPPPAAAPGSSHGGTAE